MSWEKFTCHLVSLAALLMAVDCGAAEQRRGAEGGVSNAGGSGSTSSGSRRYNRIQHGQCTYTFILPENDGSGSACREAKAGGQYNANALQRDAPQVEQEFSTQKIQHLEHVMENYTQWLHKVYSGMSASLPCDFSSSMNS